MIGLLTKDGKSIVCGDEQRHRPLLSHVKSLLSHASPIIRDFQFSALAITKGWRRLKSITDAKVTAETMPGHEEPIGERIFFPWSEKASVFTKMDASSKVNIHGKLLRWSGKAKIKVDEDEGGAYGLFLYNARRPDPEEPWEEVTLAEIGFPGRASTDGAETTTSEESLGESTEDPTLNLPPITMTNKWRCAPGRGEGWWGLAHPSTISPQLPHS